MEKSDLVKKLVKIFWIFLIGSFIGYILEMIVGLVQNGHFITRQGMIYGPFIQVYGIGLVLYYLIIPKTKNKVHVFFASMLLGGIVEYVFSFLQETIFGTVSWDYSNLWFNINGRTSLLHCIYWGIGGILFIKYIYPLINRIEEMYNRKYFRIATSFLVIFIIFDITISSIACRRKIERQELIPADGVIDVFLDQNFPDEKLDEIYSNAKEV